MYHFIITTTGLFNALRRSVFPTINNPKTATFLLGLLYKVNVYTRHISSRKYKEKRDLVHQELKLERKRIRAYADAIRGEGKWNDETLMAICESPYKCLNSSSLHDFCYPDILPVDNFIPVYDESNHSSDILVSYYAHSKTDLFQDNWSAYDGDDIEEYVQDRLTGPMMDNIIKRLSKEKLFIVLHPKAEYRKEYLDFLLPYTTERCLGEHKFIAPKEIDIIAKKVYCMLDACRSIIDNSQLYGSILPILDAIDELIGDMSLSLDSPWKVEYVKKVSRLSQWYRALVYAFTGRSGADDIFKAIIEQQEWNPLAYDIKKDYYMAEWGELSKAFDLDTVRYALLQYCVSMDYQDVYEQYLQKLCPDIILGEFDYEQQTSILLKQPIHKKDYCYAGRDVALWTKVLWKFYVDEIDPSLWNEIATLWEAWREAHCFDDLYAYQISVKYMVNLAMHFGDIQRAECYKQTVSDDVSTFMHDMGMPEFGNYPWTAISYYIMADTDQSLGLVEQAMEEFHKAYIIKTHAKSSWEFYEQCNGNAWQIPISRFEYKGTIFGYIDQADMPKLSSIEAYKRALAPYMTYIMD